ncbi:MAG: pentapeptide repeat-containing protein [Cyanobacteria bacterium SBLK]|nr:pentapeptide repeat-containing protein [Cyanobacteria bacterium SBLK]
MNWWQLRRLKNNVDRWNKWRAKNPYAEIDLREVDLGNTNLMGANLSEANLREANLMGTNLWSADLRDAHLWGVNLEETDLSLANLTKADLWMANLKSADLRGAQFIRANALNANLKNANLTGACIESWNINSKTNLEGVICDYIYLESDRRERRPYDRDRKFAPGEFARLFRKPANTFNLYFRDNIDWQAAAYAFQNIAQIDGKPLEILKIDKKYGGVVIKVNVSENADKSEIEGDFWQRYEAAKRAFAEERQSDRLGINFRDNGQINNLMNLLDGRRNIAIAVENEGELGDN